MKLKKTTLSVAMSMAAMGGSAFAATINCTLTPANSVITAGQSLQLAATCEGGPLRSIRWKQGDTFITGAVLLSGDTSKPIHYTTRAGAVGDFTFTVSGTPLKTADDVFGVSSEARVLINATASDFGAASLAPPTPTTPVDARCGVANNTAVSTMPTNGAQCASGKTALAISGPSSFTWSCLSLTGGAEASCYAPNSAAPAPAPAAPAPGPAPSVAATDPGTGLWTPPNTTGRLIADQSGPNSTFTSSYVPGCLNGSYIESAWNTGCGANTAFATGASTSFGFGSDRTLGLRYMSKADAGTVVKDFTFQSADGGNTGGLSVWLSVDPAATYAGTSSACKATSIGQPLLLTGPGHCLITPNTRYYLFMSTERADINLRFLVNEIAADFF